MSDLARAAEALAGAAHPVALTGAGISVESGIPDFRSPDGLWTDFPPEDYATIEVFLTEPEKSWQLFRALGKTIEGCEPNAAHRALAALERAGRLDAVITQNVDGLHQAAGSREVLEVHGNHRTLHCVACPGGTRPFEPGLLEPGPVPYCPACDRALKPSVVLFGEDIHEAEAISGRIQSCDVLLVIGTSAQVYPVAGFPAAVLASGGTVIEMNLERTGAFTHPGWIELEGPATRTVCDLAAAVL